MWQDGWEDDEEDENFTRQLRMELATSESSGPPPTTLAGLLPTAAGAPAAPLAAALLPGPGARGPLCGVRRPTRPSRSKPGPQPAAPRLRGGGPCHGLST